MGLSSSLDLPDDASAGIIGLDEACDAAHDSESLANSGHGVTRVTSLKLLESNERMRGGGNLQLHRNEEERDKRHSVA